MKKRKKPLYERLADNVQHIKSTLGNSGDLIVREFQIGRGEKINAAIFYTDGLTDTQSLQNFLLETVMIDLKQVNEKKKRTSSQALFDQLKDAVITVGELEEIYEFDSLFNSLLSGDAILLLDGSIQGLGLGFKGWKDRGVTESTSESVIRGPKEAFSESLRTNTALIRRRIKDPKLWMESRIVGRVTKTDVALMYIKGIVSEDVIKEVRARMDRIDIDGILEGSYIEELIQDNTITPFPLINSTERPDVIAAGLLEGRIAIIVDGSPFVLLVPVLFAQFFQAADDYYSRVLISSFVRFLRYFSFMMALFIPSIYVAITTFHQEMIPPELLFSLLAQREQTPFPAVIEALLMELAFEILREASIRMPRAISSAISIVGTLVIGQAAVQAGLVSATLIIVVSTTAIASFVFPVTELSISTRLLRFPMMLLAASFGLYGIVIAIFILLLHLCSLRSFGVPYMSPYAPINISDQKDGLIRLPLWMMRKRPQLINQKNLVRDRTPRPRPPK